MSDGATLGRGAFLRAIAPQVWPAPATVTVGHAETDAGGDAQYSYLVLPHARNPRLLLPSGQARAIRGALRGAGGNAGSARSRLVASALRMLAASGTLGLVFRDQLIVTLKDRPSSTSVAPPSVETFVAGSFARPVHLAMVIGPDRANRKPVFRVLTESGGTVGFVKVGTGPLNAALVRNEATTLRALAGRRLSTVSSPTCLAYSHLGEAPIALQSALPAKRRVGASDDELLRAALDEIALHDGGEPTSMGGGAYTTGLGRRIDRLPAEEPRARLKTALRHAVEAADHKLVLGRWHGDFTPWNCARSGNRIDVWDWERSDTGVPVGFDHLHFELQRDIAQRGAPPIQAATRLVSRAHSIVGRQVLSPEAGRVVAWLYLVDIGCRYATDQQEKAGAAIGRLDSWLYPILDWLAETPARGIPQ